MLEQLKDVAIQAARAAGAIHAARHERPLDVASKAASADLVTWVDRKAEAELVRIISTARPADAIISEEGTSSAGTSGVTWILDPLDGTANLVHGYPQHAVAIGVLIDGVRRLGVVLDTARDHLYVGVPGVKADRDGSSITVASPDELKAALVGTGFLPDSVVRLTQLDVLKSVLPQVRDIRRSGSPALDLCAVACGALDVYFEFGIGPWDIAAGAAIAEAAGAKIVELDSAPLPAPLVVAGSRSIVDKLAALLTMRLRELRTK